MRLVPAPASLRILPVPLRGLAGMAIGLPLSAVGESPPGHEALLGPFPDFAESYCLDCHNAEDRKGKFDMESILGGNSLVDFERWESVLWALQDRDMPPDDEPDHARPAEAEYQAMLSWMEPWFGKLDANHAGPDDLSQPTTMVATYCVSCHNEDEAKGSLVLEGLELDDPSVHPEILESMIHRMHARQMPPADERRRPAEQAYADFTRQLAEALDDLAARQPRPGRSESFRRLNRTEYQNAIRDLLAVDLDVAELLPADELAYGFDTVTLTGLSPTLMERYISVAQKISQLAVGTPLKAPSGHTIRVPADRTQEKHVEGLPLGTRGGALIPFHFPRDGKYEIRLRLTRDRNEQVEGATGEHDVDLLLNDRSLQRFTVDLPQQESDNSKIDLHLVYRGDFAAGPQDLAVTFPERIVPLMETRRRPFEARFNYHRHPRQTPALFQVTITGPFESTGPGAFPGRERIFFTTPEKAGSDVAAAREILGRLVRRAYRRPVTEEDLARPMEFFRQASAADGFEAGIELALSAILVSPQFLFRLERDPADLPAGQAYAISDLELASRLSFFLWSSIPDDELLAAAEQGNLRDPVVLETQIKRMLHDEKSANLATNFTGQWLHLRNLQNTTPNLRLFPDFDDNLRQSFRRETELFVDSVIREDRSALELLTADYTFLNERLARHYGIPAIRGSRFRRVELDPQFHRGGLLRQGSVLTVTSYATRTSPVLRGNWILENFLGTPAPPPPPNVPTLDGVISEKLPMRERLELHRADPACASCHQMIDGVGFALENFDAVGRYRESDGGIEIDVSGGLPDGQDFHGVDGLQAGIMQRPDMFISTLTRKLLIFALGRGVEYYDAPAVRQIVREAAKSDYQFSAIIQGIATSVPFQMRTTP